MVNPDDAFGYPGKYLPGDRSCFGGEFTGQNLLVTLLAEKDGFVPNAETVNVERAAFDKMVLDEAKRAGADVRENVTVKTVVRLNDNDVAIETDAGETLTAKYLVDAVPPAGTVTGLPV